VEAEWTEEQKADFKRILSLEETLAYHCKRCNYLWLPKDYDFEHDDIMEMKPPKSCARCKSKYWRDERVRRGPISQWPSGPIVDWATKIFAEGHKNGQNDREIAKSVIAYGRENNWSNLQISEALASNGVKRYGGKAGLVLTD
jgi:hypothetical protein